MKVSYSKPELDDLGLIIMDNVGGILVKSLEHLIAMQKRALDTADLLREGLEKSQIPGDAKIIFEFYNVCYPYAIGTAKGLRENLKEILKYAFKHHSSIYGAPVAHINYSGRREHVRYLPPEMGNGYDLIEARGLSGIKLAEYVFSNWSVKGFQEVSIHTFEKSSEICCRVSALVNSPEYGNSALDKIVRKLKAPKPL